LSKEVDIVEMLISASQHIGEITVFISELKGFDRIFGFTFPVNDLLFHTVTNITTLSTRNRKIKMSLFFTALF